MPQPATSARKKKKRRIVHRVHRVPHLACVVDTQRILRARLLIESSLKTVLRSIVANARLDSMECNAINAQKIPFAATTVHRRLRARFHFSKLFSTTAMPVLLAITGPHALTVRSMECVTMVLARERLTDTFPVRFRLPRHKTVSAATIANRIIINLRANRVRFIRVAPALSTPFSSVSLHIPSIKRLVIRAMNVKRISLVNAMVPAWLVPNFPFLLLVTHMDSSVWIVGHATKQNKIVTHVNPIIMGVTVTIVRYTESAREVSTTRLRASIRFFWQTTQATRLCASVIDASLDSLARNVYLVRRCMLKLAVQTAAWCVTEHTLSTAPRTTAPYVLPVTKLMEKTVRPAPNMLAVWDTTIISPVTNLFCTTKQKQIVMRVRRGILDEIVKHVSLMPRAMAIMVHPSALRHTHITSPLLCSTITTRLLIVMDAWKERMEKTVLPAP